MKVVELKKVKRTVIFNQWNCPNCKESWISDCKIRRLIDMVICPRCKTWFKTK